MLLIEQIGPVGLIKLNRPQALNALCAQLMDEMTDAVKSMEANDDIGAIVITGNEKAFCAGADIKELLPHTFVSAFSTNLIGANWEEVTRARKPVIAAVSGFALGGGCELAMMCDFIIAGDNARFGQPEIKIGTIPGAGGSQRLTRLVGKTKAMEMILTGRMMDAQEAERSGLVSRVVPVAELLDDAIKTATTIANLSRPIVQLAKEAVNLAYETTLHEGVYVERRLWYATFATEDQKEGMAAFAEKRPPSFKNK